MRTLAPTTPKVVLVAPNWLGDAVMSLPALGLLAASGATLSVLSRPYTARVYAGIDGVHERIITGAAGRSGRIVESWRALRAVRASAVVLGPPSFSSAFPAWMARVPVRVGHGGDGRDGLLTDAVPTPPRGSEHLSESYVRLARRVLERSGVAVPDGAVPATLRVFDRDREEANGLRASIGSGGAYAVVVPGAAYGPAKSWPANRFRALVKVVSTDMSVLVAGGPSERELCESIATGIEDAHAVAGATSLGGFFALAAGARVVIANDSGTPHAAAALGTPTVVLFGSTSPEWTRPLGGHVTVLRHPVHCSPCFRRTCPTRLECFAGITVDAVVAATRAAASKKGVA